MDTTERLIQAMEQLRMAKDEYRDALTKEVQRLVESTVQEIIADEVTLPKAVKRLASIAFQRGQEAGPQ